MANQSKARRITGWVLSIILTGLFIFSSVFKFIRAQPAVEAMEKWGLGDKILLIGIGELVSAVLFLIPRTTSIGLLLLSAYMGGAIVTHMQNGEPYVTQSVMLVIIWAIAYLRNPEFFQSLRGA